MQKFTFGRQNLYGGFDMEIVMRLIEIRTK